MPPREPRVRAAQPTATAGPSPAAAAPEEIPPNKRDLTAFEFPSAKTGLENPIELGDPNPMRLHVKGNFRGIAYSQQNERLRALGKIDKGAKKGTAAASVKADGTAAADGAAAAPGHVSVKAAVSAAKRPAQKRQREL